MPKKDSSSAGADEDVRPGSGFSAEVIGRLAGRESAFGRYTLEGEVAHGGQGAILRVWDDDLHRHLAMKVILGDARPAATGDTPTVDQRTLSRFLEEAQVTGQLDHPGIVPVHELGLDAEGRIYFTMKLVKGEDLRGVFAKVHRGEDGWTRAGVLGLLLKVCEAMSYAHDKGVIHRDLKPGNVMVGRYGEAYVMDWGIARVLGQEDDKDIRIRTPAASTSIVRSDRRHEAGQTPDSPLITMDGDVVGTPSYMSPEQAAGNLDAIGPKTDVYAVGAMLYHLLGGTPPYVTPGAPINNYALWSRVQEGPPKPITDLTTDAPAELVAICEKAMARDPGDRYEDMSELASDLRALLEQRVVSAYRTGALPELRKWVLRNKPLASSLMAVFVLLLVGGLTFAWLADHRRTLSDNLEAALEEKTEALAIARTAQADAEENWDAVLQLSAASRLENLRRDADDLWPVARERITDYDVWLEQAESLVSELDGHRHRLESLRQEHARISGRDEAAPSIQPESLRRQWQLSPDDLEWWMTRLSALISDIEAFSDPETGLISGLSAESGWGMQRRRDTAGTVDRLTITGEEARRRWDESITSIGDPEQCPEYAGLSLTPQFGLLPIGRDPESRLWEFWHAMSGEEPTRTSNGRLSINADTGIVLVLIPGGPFFQGAQGEDPSGPNYDPDSFLDGFPMAEGPVHEVTLSPYFISKYEVTQRQWQFLTDRNPSSFAAGQTHGPTKVTLLHPVTDVTWQRANQVLKWVGLTLPSESQWERAARGGTSSPFWWGDDSSPLTIPSVANIGDQSALQHGVIPVLRNDTEVDDGWPIHSPVGAMRPNPFGLHDVTGNVWEWCLDAYTRDYYASSPSIDPVNLEYRGGSQQVVQRGGSFRNGSWFLRSAAKSPVAPSSTGDHEGVRPVRRVRQ